MQKRTIIVFYSLPKWICTIRFKYLIIYYYGEFLGEVYNNEDFTAW